MALGCDVPGKFVTVIKRTDIASALTRERKTNAAAIQRLSSTTMINVVLILNFPPRLNHDLIPFLRAHRGHRRVNFVQGVSMGNHLLGVYHTALHQHDGLEPPAASME